MLTVFAAVAQFERERIKERAEGGHQRRPKKKAFTKAASLASIGPKLLASKLKASTQRKSPISSASIA